MKKYVFCLVGSLSICVFVSCSKKQDQQTQGAAPPPPQELVRKMERKNNVAIDADFPVQLEGQQDLDIRPKIEGFIKRIYIDEGQKVVKGQHLFSIETNSLTQSLVARQAVIRARQVDVDRLKPLVQEGIIGSSQLASAEAALEQAKADYSSVKESIAYSEVYSPTDGWVGTLPYKTGALVNTASVLTTVSNTQKIRAYFSMNEKQYLDLLNFYKKKNAKELIQALPEVSLSLPDNTLYKYKGKIEAIDGHTDQQTGSVLFRALFPNSEYLLRSGGSGALHFPQYYNDVFVVPQDAVFEMQDKQMVYAMDKDKRIYSKNIKTKSLSGGQDYIVTEGLENGDLIVLQDVFKLKKDQQIEPIFESDSAAANQTPQEKK